MEALLHYIWAERLWQKLIPVGELAGMSIEVIDPGQLNLHAGPDFLGARIRLGDLLWIGSVEIHSASAEWHQHGHSTDPAYRSVILHIVERDNSLVTGANGSPLPTCLVMVPQAMKDAPSEYVQHLNQLRCPRGLAHLNYPERLSWLRCLYRERLQRKHRQLQMLLERSGGDWDQAGYALLLRALGFGLNSEPMERLAFALPLHILQKHLNQPQQIEALLLGVSGLLEVLPPCDERSRLQDEYAFLSHKYSLQTLPPGLFRRARTRPTNLPEYRLLQFSALLTQLAVGWTELLLSSHPKSSYPHLSKPLREPWRDSGRWRGSGALSRSTCLLLWINALLPYGLSYRHLYQGQSQPDLEAQHLLEELPPESNHVTRLFASEGLQPQNALESQALLQLHEGYCQRGDCTHCAFDLGHRSSLPSPHETPPHSLPQN